MPGLQTFNSTDLSDTKTCCTPSWKENFKLAHVHVLNLTYHCSFDRVSLLVKLHRTFHQCQMYWAVTVPCDFSQHLLARHSNTYLFITEPIQLPLKRFWFFPSPFRTCQNRYLLPLIKGYKDKSKNQYWTLRYHSRHQTFWGIKNLNCTYIQLQKKLPSRDWWKGREGMDLACK